MKIAIDLGVSFNDTHSQFLILELPCRVVKEDSFHIVDLFENRLSIWLFDKNVHSFRVANENESEKLREIAFEYYEPMVWVTSIFFENHEDEFIQVVYISPRP